MEKVILFGNGQVASEAYYHFLHDTPHEVVAFTVDSDYIKEDTLFGLPVLPFEDVENIYSPSNYKIQISIGYAKMNKVRAERYYEAKSKGFQLINYVNSNTITWPGSVIGENCRIGYCQIAPFAEIGNNVTITDGCIVRHHTLIKDHCYIAAGVVLSGSVTVEPYCVIGANATIRDNVTIARECMIGAGAVILKDTKESEVYMGTPAELLPISSDDLPLRISS